MADNVEAFLLELGKLDGNIFRYDRDNIRSSPMVRCGRLDPEAFIQNFKHLLEGYEATATKGRSQGFNVGDAKNLSHDELEKITNGFCEENFIQHIGYGRLFRGFIDDVEGMREVTVKTWDFIFPGDKSYDSYPRKFRDEIVLLERSEFKSHPCLMKLIGFCFDKKLAVVYDMKFKTPLWDAVCSAEFGWKERMKVATDYALLLITLSRKQFDVWTNGCTDSMIDEEYNIKLLDFRVHAFPQTLGVYNSVTASDQASIEKATVFEIGILLLELITKKERKWKDGYHRGYYIEKLNRRSIVHESFEIDADTGTRMTQLIQSCVRPAADERPHIDSIFDTLVSIGGYSPTVPESCPRIDSL